MKEITWLHISDLHSCPEKSSWDADFILNKFLRDIKKLKNEHNLSPDLIFVTGDLIYGNKSECGELKSQHESAALFLLSLIEECNVEIENLFLVPGNHDVDIKKILGSQTKWLKDINIQEIHKMIQTNNDEWQSITKRLANYRNFLDKELEAKHLLSNSDQMIFSEQRSINEIKIGIAGLNTAWSSCGDGEKEKGNLWCGGEWQIKTLLKNLNNSDIKIGLSHHPFNWFYATEDPKILHTMQTNFHFHLHGHEHQGWVEPLEDSHHCRIAAGAIFVGHNKTNQSSYNFVRLDFEKQQCEIWFRGYDETGDGGWVTKEIPGKTDSRGVKVISIGRLFPDLNKFFSTTPVQEYTVTPKYPPSVSAAYFRGIYGRDKDINILSKALSIHQLVVISGMPGIGKTQIINEVLEYSLQGSWEIQRFRVEDGWGLDDLYSIISPVLGNTEEYPLPPPLLFGKRDWNKLIKTAKKVKPVVFHIGRTENLVKNGNLADSAVEDFFITLSRLPQVRLIFECRELLDKNFIHSSVKVKIIDLKGLQLNALKAFFARPKPVLQPSLGWELKDDEAESIFKRLGGSEKGRGRAHPFGMRLLSILAEETGRNPADVLKSKKEVFYKKLEQELFLELYKHVLTKSRKKMLEHTALYRGEIPDQHVDSLNKIADDPKAFDDLRHRFIINSSPGEDYYYVHDIIRELTHRRMNKEGHDIEEHHHRLSRLWLQQVSHAKRSSGPNRRAATEAFYHILQSGSYTLLSDLPPEMIRGGGADKKSRNNATEIVQ